MKLKFTFIVLSFFAFFLSRGQSPITLDSLNMPYAGWNDSVALDTPVTSVNYGNAGANQVYNFGTLTRSETQFAHYVALSGSQQTAFPNANLAVTGDYSTYIMAKNS